MTAGMVLDVLIVALLVLTVGFAFVLNRRLATLRSAQDEFRELLSGFNKATERAQTGVFQLKAAAEEVGGKLRGDIDKARTAVDELNFMIDAGDRLAERLDGGISAAREGASGTGAAAVVEMADHRPGDDAATRSTTENRLLDTLRQAK